MKFELTDSDAQKIIDAMYLASAHYRKMGLALEWDGLDNTQKKFTQQRINGGA